MDGADKVTDVNARSMQPAVTAITPPKQGGVVAETEKSEKQTAKGDTIQKNGVAEQASREEIEQTVSEIGDFVQNIQRNLQFTVDDNSGETIIKVTDKETDDVIRQIPSEEVLQLQQYIKDASGILFKAKV
jgi:flagellar protein FlaG